MGGVGKTALALKVADLIKDRYPDAQFYINLFGTSDTPVATANALAHVIRAYYPTTQLPDTEVELRALYQTVLHDKRALIMLDDAKNAAQVVSLLPPASCGILITSRYHFQVAGLRAIEISELPPDDAKDLLLKIAPRIGAYADTIAQLGGYLPLAIRAAASLIEATPDLDSSTYTDQLRDERTRLERIGAEGVDISIKASLNLSYNHLSPESALVFRRLAVFPSSFYAVSEEIVCKDVDHVHLSILTRLTQFRINWFTIASDDMDTTAPHSRTDGRTLLERRAVAEGRQIIAS
jgi:predicted ATPase